jgi:hypothetical protein
VDYVRHRRDPDVHLLVTGEDTGGGGLSMGFSYRFGSIFNNVVNARFNSVRPSMQ